MNYKINGFIHKNHIKIKFVFVGVWNTLFGCFVFLFFESLLSSFVSPPYLAYTLAMVFGQILAITNAFISHKHITFKSPLKGIELIKEFFRFVATYAFISLLNIALLPIFVEIFHIQPRISGIIIIFFAIPLSYFGHSRFSFKKSGVKT